MNRDNQDAQKWVQVDTAAHYDPLTYLEPARMASIGYQVRLLAEHFPGAEVLEVGVGAKLAAHILTTIGHPVTTLDVDRRLEPDILGSVTEIPTDDARFDSFLCCQVLEHLPWNLVSEALGELRRVVRLGGVISVPSNRTTWAIIKHDTRSSNGHRRITFRSRRNRPLKNKSGEHHWELESNVTTSDFLQKLKEAGFTVVEEKRPIQNLYHHFFVLRKQ
jgi:ubiquinone/menaquinone biosynthesis C-methylase UbiE